MTRQLLPPLVPALAVVHLAVALRDLLARLDVPGEDVEDEGVVDGLPVGHADHALAEVTPHEGRVARVVEEG